LTRVREVRCCEIVPSVDLVWYGHVVSARGHRTNGSDVTLTGTKSAEAPMQASRPLPGFVGATRLVRLARGQHDV
jgi:hypothetical protein